MNIRLFKKSDWNQVKTIYQLGIDTGVATFETTPPANVSLWLAKINPKLTFVLELVSGMSLLVVGFFLLLHRKF